LSQHLEEFSYGETQSWVDYRIAAYQAHQGKDVQAALHATRALTINPDVEIRHRAEELLTAVLRDNRNRWEYSWERSLSAVATLAQSAEEDYGRNAPRRTSAERHLSMVQMLEVAPIPAFREAALGEIRRLLLADPADVDMPAVLHTGARIHESLDRRQEAIKSYTVIQQFYPESRFADEATQRIRVLRATDESEQDS